MYLSFDQPLCSIAPFSPLSFLFFSSALCSHNSFTFPHKVQPGEKTLSLKSGRRQSHEPDCTKATVVIHSLQSQQVDLQLGLNKQDPHTHTHNNKRARPLYVEELHAFTSIRYSFSRPQLVCPTIQ